MPTSRRSQQGPARPLPVAEGVVIAAVGLALMALLLWLVRPAPPVGFYWDDGWYLLMAEWFSGRLEFRELAWNMLHLRQYPPGYPALLAVFGAGLDRPDAGFMINAVGGALAAAATMLWMRRTEGFSLVPALAAAAILVLNPVALTWLPSLFSEHLFILLTVCALWLAVTASTPRAWVLMGLIVGAAILTRSAGVALLVAVAISLALTDWRRLPWLVLGLVPVLFLGYWLVSDLPSVPRYRASLAEMGGNLVDPAYLWAQCVGMAQGWSLMWGSMVGGLLALVVAAPGFVTRFRRRRADAWFLPVSLLMLLAWPFPDHMPRLLWPLMPALLVCAAESIRGFQQPAVRLAMLWALPAVLLLGLYGGAVRTVMRSMDPPQAPLQSLSRMYEWTRAEDPALARDALEFRHGLLSDMQRIEAETPPNACIYSEYPVLVAVQARRASVAAPWNRLADLPNHQLLCEFYYLVPLALPQTSPEDLERTANRHQELFRSANPLDPSSPDPPGILYRLRPQ